MKAMGEAEVREFLRVGFEYTYAHDDWVFPLDQALEGISAEQAAWRPGPDLMGIWDIVLHLAVWNENIVERIETGLAAHPAEGAWPPKAETATQVEWEKAKARLWGSVESLKSLLATAPFEKIHKSPYGFPDLLCRFTHMGYHLGQIEKLRECKGW